eukprot:13655712-Alexandrium_andersonii.AAC.1
MCIRDRPGTASVAFQSTRPSHTSEPFRTSEVPSSRGGSVPRPRFAASRRLRSDSGFLATLVLGFASFRASGKAPSPSLDLLQPGSEWLLPSSDSETALSLSLS